MLWPGSASAATINVTSTADVATNFGACGSAATVPTGTSLREAICAANNAGATSTTINVAAGTYTLSNGELAMGKVAGSNITLNGAGSASTIIDGNHNSRVFDLDPNVVGGVTTSISGITVTNGRDGTFGGAGLIAGGGHNAADNLTVSNSVFSNNQANFAVPTASSKPGGGMSFQGGNLNLTNVNFTGNQSFSSAGAGLWYQTFEAGGTLTLTGSTFSGNSTANSGASGTSGGALALSAGAGGATYNVSNTDFISNTSTSSGTGEAAAGGAIFQTTGNLTLTGGTFTNNSVSGSGATGGPIIYTAGNSTMHYNRFVGNTGTGGVMTNSGTGVANVTENWWGCNTGPNTAGCETSSGTNITAAPRLVLTATASPAHVVRPGQTTATITASLLSDSASAAVSAANLVPAFDGLPVSFADPAGDATVGGSPGAHSVNLASGVTSIGYQAGTVLGPDNVLATLDNGTATAILEVDQPPAITSANIAHFQTSQAGSFTITTTGYPAAAITEVGSLPSGLTFHDNGDGSATISGTPAAGTGGNYSLALTANNGYPPNATQTLTVNVSQPPAFTSAATATFVIGQAGSFSVTTSGFPTVATITESGALPAGVTFTDNGNGTATIAGTPTGTGNTYPVTLTASNGVSPNATQNLTIQVNQAPAITLNPSDQTVQPGQSVSFTAAASGVPTPTVQWQRSTDGGASFVNIAGATSTTYTFTAALGDNGNQYRAVFTNIVGSATTTAATLNVGIAPAFTSADHTSFVVGQAGSFSITTTGVPSATLSRTGAQFPAWLTLTDNGDGTGTLTGTPPAGSAGSYQFTLKAANGFSPSASQIFTLFVDDSPVITSADHATFTAGQAGSFAVTTTAGFPTTTAITETGSLPSGVTFHDNGDGTATLAGTPAAGTGGSYPITITATATGGLAAPATQSFTLTVLAPPVITSANHATFSAGTPGSFTVTTSAGNPATTTLSKTGTLPAGVSFTDNGDGTATIAGTPSLGSGGVYTITITASNGVAPDTTQSFTLTVNEPPHITSADHATFTVNTANSFTVSTAGGQPSAITITETGSLPAGVTFTDNGDGTATLAGTPTTGGTFPITITASNGVLPNATQAFTLTVNATPTITSANHTTFTVGNAGSFTVTTNPGVPAATTLTETGSLPSGVSFTDNGDGTATLAGTPAAGTGGSYPLTLTATNTVGHTDQAFTLTVNEPTSITSANHATFQLGTAGTFTVTTAGGFPTPPVLSETGSLPAGVTFTDNGDGTATIAGSPSAGGSFPITITANNGVAPNATQAFTLTVNASPVITSADHTTFAVGSAGSFTVTTNPGVPAATTITKTGALPAGVSFTDNGDGTATLAGTPAAGSGGSYPLTITASNGVLPNSTQAFTLTVTELPAITSANHTTFAVGSAGSFSVTTHVGFPTATTLTETGSLPAGVTFTDNGDGTATLAGTPAAGTGGSYPLTFTATNTAGHTDQAFTLTVTDTPVITSADHTTFAVGTAGTFTVTTNPGSPATTTLTESGALPSGVTFHDNGNGTATLAGTPAAGSGGSYPLTITASNGVLPNSTQAFTLTVTELPAITSANHATFALNAAGSFTVTTHAGFPTATTLTEAGSLPPGVTFTDNGNGTATLAGTPTAVGSYPITLTATNSAGHVDQAFTLTVAASPTITSANHTTFTAGTSGTFTVTTSGGFPTPPALTETGSLPGGVTFHDNGNGTATLSGTPTAGGTFPITITANNGVAPAVSQSFTLTVNGAPIITSSNVTTFTAGLLGIFKVTTQSSTGTVTLKVTGTLPKFVIFIDNHNGTGYLTGIPLPSTVGTYHLTITASNGVLPNTTQAFTLIVKKATVVALPKNQPPSNGVLGGVPTQTTPGQVLHLSGAGFAAGAPLTIGYYPGSKVLAYSIALPDGSFFVNIPVTTLGSHTYVVAGIGADGNLRYLEAASNTVTASAGGLQVDSNGALPLTGPKADIRVTSAYGLAAILAGWMLMMATRRRRTDEES